MQQKTKEQKMKEYREVSLRDKNTFGIDVRCERLVEVENTAQLKTLFGEQRVGEGEWMVLSRGSNILFASDFIEGTVIHPVNRRVEIRYDDDQMVIVRAEAGVEWDDFVVWCVERELWGVENLSYIPGYVGAAPVQNIGAYGVEVKDVIRSVEMFEVKSQTNLILARDNCDFGYRDSIFKHLLKGKVIIMAVNFVLHRIPRPNMGYGELQQRVMEGGAVTLRGIRDAVVEIRRAKLPEPSELGNAGSFFKNPIVPSEVAQRLKKEYPSMPLYPTENEGRDKLAAGWLIDQCGWRGRREGRVGVHEKQALVLINYGGATGAEVLMLAERIRESVEQKFGVELELEVNIV